MPPLSERDALLAWFDANARELPWRVARTPWSVWVSEVMLQQTRVETVIPYFRRFLSLFPSPQALSEAREDDVLAAFSGLGYYRRARLLRRGAEAVVARHGGQVPPSLEALRALPGVGRYTAGAIASLAFGIEAPIVDGNVARVLSRARGIEDALGTRASETRLWAEAEALARGPRPGALNEALMELGATVCTPAAPRCPGCPLRAGCVAREAGRQAELPKPRARKAPREVSQVVVVARTHDGRLWLVRGEEALFGGLFGLPATEGHGVRAARAALAAAGLEGEVTPRPRGRFTHVLTHRRLDVQVYVARAEGPETDARRAVREADVAGLGRARLTDRALALAPP